MTNITEQWVAGGLLEDNTSVTVRPIRPSDAGLIDAMHHRLSPHSIYYRYLQPRIPTVAEFEQVARIAPPRGAGFVATAQRDGEIIVGLAYYVRESHGQQPTAEAGILVEDQFQGQGIGRRLWQRMQRHALANEIHSLRVLFHYTNQRVMRLVQGGGFAYQTQWHSDLSEYLVALGERPHQAQTSWQVGSAGDFEAASRQTRRQEQERSAQNGLHWNWTIAPQSVSPMVS